MMLRIMSSNAIDFKTIITVFLGFIGLLFKFNSRVAVIWTSVGFLLAVVGLAVLETY